MYQGKQRSVEIHEDGRLVAVGGMKDFIIDTNMEGTEEAEMILSLNQGQSINLPTDKGWVKVRRNDDV